MILRDSLGHIVLWKAQFAAMSADEMLSVKRIWEHGPCLMVWLLATQALRGFAGGKRCLPLHVSVFGRLGEDWCAAYQVYSRTSRNSPEELLDMFANSPCKQLCHAALSSSSVTMNDEVAHKRRDSKLWVCTVSSRPKRTEHVRPGQGPPRLMLPPPRRTGAEARGD